MPLKLSLKPGEKFVLNGAVVQNGDRRGVLILQNKASVLREKDIMQPEDVNTPARRVYFPVMMMYLDESAAPKVYDEFAMRLTEFMGATRNPQVLTNRLIEMIWARRDLSMALSGLAQSVARVDHRRRFQSRASIRVATSRGSTVEACISPRVTCPNSRYSISRGFSARVAAVLYA